MTADRRVLARDSYVALLYSISESVHHHLYYILTYPPESDHEYVTTMIVCDANYSLDFIDLIYTVYRLSLSSSYARHAIKYERLERPQNYIPMLKALKML